MYLKVFFQNPKCLRCLKCLKFQLDPQPPFDYVCNIQLKIQRPKALIFEFNLRLISYMISFEVIKFFFTIFKIQIANFNSLLNLEELMQVSNNDVKLMI